MHEAIDIEFPGEVGKAGPAVYAREDMEGESLWLLTNDDVLIGGILADVIGWAYEENVVELAHLDSMLTFAIAN